MESRQVENWASDFAQTPAYDLLPDPTKEHAVAIVAEFLRRLSDFTEEEVRRALLEEMPCLDISEPTRSSVPTILRSFLETLQDQGRVAGGRSLGRFVGALAPAYRERLKPGGGIRISPVVKKTADIGRNDPCPCGSGKKYKKCCRR